MKLAVYKLVLPVFLECIGHFENLDSAEDFFEDVVFDPKKEMVFLMSGKDVIGVRRGY